MTHDELLAKINFKIEDCTCEGWGNNCWENENIPWKALRAVVELHHPELLFMTYECYGCTTAVHSIPYPCRTIQAIEKELQ